MSSGDVSSARLAFYLPSLAVGGAEQVTIRIANGLAERGHDVELVVSRREGKLDAKVSPDLTVTPLSGRRVPVAGIGADVPALARYLRRSEPAVLFAQMTHGGVVCLAADRLVDTATSVVPVKHCAFGATPNSSLKGRTLHTLAKRLFPAADHVVAVSEGVVDSLVDTIDLPRERVSVLHNPVDVGAIRSRASERVDHEWVANDDVELVTSVGRLEARKDLDTWLRAFARVHAAVPNTRAVLAGQGSRRDDLRALADELGVADVVSFPGYVNNQYRYMYGSDVFLLTSRYEGLPTVLIEALACGCPVVSTDCPAGPREILDDGTYGRLPPVGDIAAIADAVRDTLADPPAADRQVERARDFEPTTVLDEYEQFLSTHVLDRQLVTVDA